MGGLQDMLEDWSEPGVSVNVKEVLVMVQSTRSRGESVILQSTISESLVAREQPRSTRLLVSSVSDPRLQPSDSSDSSWLWCRVSGAQSAWCRRHQSVLTVRCSSLASLQSMSGLVMADPVLLATDTRVELPKLTFCLQELQTMSNTQWKEDMGEVDMFW